MFSKIKETNDEGGNEKTLLLIFPEELWELVAEKLETTEDIQNLIKALPELPNLPKGKQFSWLIADLMPLIMSKFLTVKDIYSCRLVSKRWRSSIGISLENHPDRLPYKSERLTQVTEEHFNYSPAPAVTTHLENVLKSLHPIEPTFEVSWNPFPSRVVSVYIKIPCMDKKVSITNLVEALSVLRVLGHHIWYLRVYFNVDEGSARESFINDGVLPLFESLAFMPNLRSLDISGEAMNCKIPVSLSLPAFQFHLETLDLLEFSMIPEELFNTVVKTFCSSCVIKRLGIHRRDWKSWFASFFPNLIELHFRSDFEFDMYDMLCDLRSSHSLRKLKISVNVLNISRVFENIGNSPWKLESLEISAFEIFYSDWKGDMLLPSIRSLNLSTPCFHIKLLKSLPQLKYLTLWEKNRDNFWLFGSNWSTRKDIILRLFLYFNSKKDKIMSMSKIWGKLRKLKMLTTTIERGKFVSQYAREAQSTVFESRGRDYWTI